MPGKALVVDANILIRAVLGKRVRGVIDKYAGRATFFVPEVAYSDAEERLPLLVMKRGGDPRMATAVLRSLSSLVELVGIEVCTGTWRQRPVSGLASATRKTGRS